MKLTHHSFRIFHDKKLIANIGDLEFPEKGLVVIQAGNGCGKTTYLRFLSRIISPGDGQWRVTGDVRLDGESIFTQRKKHYRGRKVGLLLQQPEMFPRMSALESVALPLIDRGAKKSLASRKARKALADVGLGEVCDDDAMSLSGGQQQRVALARMLVCEPKILALDEPTAALDEVSEKTITGLIKAYAADHLVLMVTHDRNRAELNADLIVTLSKPAFLPPF